MGGFSTKKCVDPAHSQVRECPGSRAHGLHELSWRLGVLHGERHGARLLLLVAPGRVVWGWCVALPGLPSYPVAQKLSPVLTEHGVVFTRQFTDASVHVACSRCPHMEWATRAWQLYLAVIVAVSGCFLWRTIGFSGRCLGRNAWFDCGWFSVVSGCCLWSTFGFPWRCYGRYFLFDSGCMFCVSFERLFDEFHTFSMMQRTRINGEVCSADAPVYGLFHAAHTWNSCIISTTIRGRQWV